LLPEEREQKLVTQVDELQQNLDSFLEVLKTGLEMYQAIDNLPFISLPKPQQETVTNLEQNIADVRGTVQQVMMGIQEFRDGVSDEIGRVTGLLDDITARLGETRQNLAQINSNLEALQDLAVRLRSQVTLIFTLISIISTLLLAWLIYTQVEIIRLYIQRWKGLNGAAVKDLSAESPMDFDMPDKFDAEEQEQE
jgi:uncharacterized phage infection (PIP) family protein YhgE